MKSIPPSLKLLSLALACGTVATSAAFGQTIYTWINNTPLQLAGNGDFAVATNWSPNGIPVGTSGPDIDGLRGDICVFDGTTTNNLIITQTGAGGSGQDGGFGGPTGVRLHLTSGQTHSVTIKAPTPSSGATTG